MSRKRKRREAPIVDAWMACCAEPVPLDAIPEDDWLLDQMVERLGLDAALRLADARRLAAATARWN